MSTDSTPTADVASDQCQAYLGAHPCPNDAVELVDGVLLCLHHAEKADIYDYPRRPGGCR